MGTNSHMGTNTKEICPTCLVVWAATNLFFAALFGAFVLYALHRLNNRQPFSLFSVLQVRMENRPLMIFTDMIASSAIGAGVVMLLLNPATLSEAGAGGLGLTGVL